ncbi:putative glycosyltransferase YdaM [Tepiditoga spiralis]|uniref:Putative glycosyltransferase YdaM n=1 Tax=Tepiditoga spiralis TaxID=2108365 RepID=A0A7G1GCB7_9BACT|nr:glycosyltransferase family 2 protein [Tepiditoga spiralis]BBE32099.1 putative glycosyltransferase YdaM [Tepiditoga spiralis]
MVYIYTNIFILAMLITVLGRYKNLLKTYILKKQVKLEKPKNFVSVIVPVWNEEVVIEKTLINILNSTYENLEVIVLDDNSKDSTYDIVKNMTQKYKNLFLYKKQGKQGKPESLNEAVKYSNGDIILFLDADSLIEKDYIENYVKLFSKEKIEMIFTDFEPYNYQNKIIFEYQRLYFEVVKNLFYSNLFSKMIFMGNGLFIRKETLEKELPFDKNSLVDDFHMALKLKKSKIKEYFIIEPKVKIQYATNFKDLWNQHTRWYIGGIKEAISFIKSGNYSMLLTFIIGLFIVFSPFLFVVLDYFYKLKLIKYFVMPIYFSIWSVIVSSYIFNLKSINLNIFKIIFIVIPCLICTQHINMIFSLFKSIKKNIKWYKVKRTKI